VPAIWIVDVQQLLASFSYQVFDIVQIIPLLEEKVSGQPIVQPEPAAGTREGDSRGGNHILKVYYAFVLPLQIVLYYFFIY
jgi:hypothetical protein